MSELIVDQATDCDLSSESKKRSKPFEALRSVKQVKFEEKNIGPSLVVTVEVNAIKSRTLLEIGA